MSELKNNTKKQTTTLYKYVKLDYVDDIISKGRLYLSDGSNFNDPFELCVVDKNNKEIRTIKGLHILCLTNSLQNRLVWSHYSDAHKSLCISIEIPIDFIYPVCYSRKRIFIDSDLDDIMSKSKRRVKKNLDKSYKNLSFDKKVAFIKDYNWEYEKEYRLVFDKNDENLLEFEDNKWYYKVKIKAVYFGANFDKNDKIVVKKIQKMCNENHVECKKMFLDSSSYAVRVLTEKNKSGHFIMK